MSKFRTGAVLAWLAGVLSAGAAAFSLVRRLMSPRHRSETEEEYRDARHRVLILGGGFGGTTIARELGEHYPNDHDVSILVVDRSTNLLYTPLLWTVADGRVNPNHVSVSIRGLQRNSPFHFLQADVRHIDLDRREVETSAGVRGYDTLVIALGSVTSIPDLPGLHEHARRFASPGDAIELRNHLIDAVEAAHRTRDPRERAEWLTFVVGGGGDTGVELAATIHEYLTNGLLAAYPWLADERPRVIVAGRNDRLIPMSTPETSAYVRDVLSDTGIEVLTATSILSATDREVVTDRGPIPARTLFWAAGISAQPVVRAVPIAKARNGALEVDDRLRIKGRDDVFVVGDSAWAFNANDGTGVPPTAQAAQSQGRYVADLIYRRIEGDLSPPPPYTFHERGRLALLGRQTGVAEIGGRVITGLPAWFLWHAYYITAIPSWRNRVRLLGDLVLAGISGRETTQLELDPRPVADSHRSAGGRHEQPGTGAGERPNR
ncbi:MAG TPA: NAD(P)/FAD-dependent oxidoreductase [Thermomicrobiales bacterium]|jgi:NADH dehydrogenase|nr:NAD(P)/FAD-dependent oxidoreductase [Thermomicrobiales bacterium]